MEITLYKRLTKSFRKFIREHAILFFMITNGSILVGAFSWLQSFGFPVELKWIIPFQIINGLAFWFVIDLFKRRKKHQDAITERTLGAMLQIVQALSQANHGIITDERDLTRAVKNVQRIMDEDFLDSELTAIQFLEKTLNTKLPPLPGEAESDVK